MAEELTRVLERRAERGTPRGATTVLEKARVQAAADGRRPRWKTGPAIAAAAALLVLVVAGAILLATRLVVSDNPPVVTTPSTAPVTPTTIASAPIPAAAISPDRVQDLAIAPDGSLWAATTAGVVRWDLATAEPEVFSQADGLGGVGALQVEIAPDGTVWAAGPKWVARYDGSWTTVGDDIISGYSVLGDLAVGPDGAAWIAAGSETLLRLDGEGTTSYPVLDSVRLVEPWSFSMAVDASGTLWATAIIDGEPGIETRLLAFNGEWSDYGVENGLPGTVVGNVAIATDGSVWVGGDGVYGDPLGDIPAGGIARLTGDTWTTFTTTDGLLSNDGEVVAGHDGEIWVLHSALPEFDPNLLSGLSHFDGTVWKTYPDLTPGGRAVVDAAGTLWMASEAGIVGFDGNESTLLIVGPDFVSEPGEATVLERVEELEPIRISTSIGEIEFTTWALPDKWDGLWWVSESSNGVVAYPSPELTSVSSRDGVTWTGTGVEPDYPGSRADGPGGAVQVNPSGEVMHWNGTEWVAASQPPDRAVHEEGTASCVAPGWVGEGGTNLGPVIAVQEGFVILASRFQDDWSKSPVCEPLMWFSPDGDVWLPTSDQSPLGERSFIHDYASVDNRVVAVGGLSPREAAVWVSDDGLSWTRGDLEAAELWFVAGGERGWIAVGHEHAQGTLGHLWFSTDGLIWDGPYERPAGWGDRAGLFAGIAMLDDRIVGSGRQFNSPASPMDSAVPRVVIGVFIDE